MLSCPTLSFPRLTSLNTSTHSNFHPYIILLHCRKEGLQIWDAYDDKVVTSRPFLLMETADGPGMTGLNGLVGHHRVYGCRLYCPLKGRHKDGKPHYHPVMMRPTHYAIAGCSHPDVDPETLSQPSEAEYLQNLQHLLLEEYKPPRAGTHCA